MAKDKDNGHLPWGKPFNKWNTRQLIDGLKDCDPDFFPHIGAKIEAELKKRAEKSKKSHEDRNY